MQMMRDHYGKPVILLIDEYDVPIAKASAKGYYPEMLEVIKGLMSKALKDNDALRFAVITGCLRIAKESIFTGTNNFVSDTISSSHLNEYFGFTQADVDQILKDADCMDATPKLSPPAIGRIRVITPSSGLLLTIEEQKFLKNWRLFYPAGISFRRSKKI